MNNRSHELAAETQVTALLPASTLNTNAWMLTLLWTSIQADKQRESESDREKMATEGSRGSSIITTVFRSTCTVSYYHSNRRAPKGLMRSSQSQGPEKSVNPVNKRQQKTEQRINVSKKKNLRGVIHYSCDCWNVPAISTSSAVVW